MKIGIVAPSPVPFAIGGAENLWWGLQHYINQSTPHQAELIKLPCPESSFWELMDSYQRFSNLDISHFDLVISTKYPAWMVLHPKHICYMQHRLRGLYDTYPVGFAIRYNSRLAEIVKLQDFMQHNPGNRGILGEFFEMLLQLRFNEEVPSDAFAFPGPLARQVIHFLDGIGLAQDKIRKFCAISKNVVTRKNYFPADTRVEVVYHPSNLRYFRNKGGDYLFTVSRLDGPKRISLLIEAMRHVKANIEMRIAGTGPDAAHLMRMAAGDKRIFFLGFAKDEEVIDLYAGALAVPYVPYDEDYGLITIEAMMSSKPVLTVTDSGGPTEFVHHGQTGFMVAPDAKALAERIDYLCENRDEAWRMGHAALRTVSGITWENVVARLLDGKPAQLCQTARTRKKITVAATFPVFPPRGGGQSRIFHLYRHLAKWFDIELVTFAHGSGSPFSGEIAPGLREIRIPKSLQHERAESQIAGAVNGIPVTDVTMPQLYHMTPAYTEALRESASSAQFVVASHPYLFGAIREVSNSPIWYEAQDVEYELKKNILPKNANGRKLLEAVRNIEAECCQVSDLIMVCSEEDGAALQRIYNIEPRKIVEVPNGADIDVVKYVALEDRRAAKRRLGLEHSFIAMFMGSWHEPNLEALRAIVDMADELPDIHFIVMGSAGMAFENKQMPGNIGLMGVVDDATKDMVLGVADVALNPMASGSGTNLKMLDYFAAGIPVISTPIGMRGLGVRHGTHLILSDLYGFPDAIRDIRREDDAVLIGRIERARQHVEDRFGWARIADNFYQAMKYLA